MNKYICEQCGETFDNIKIKANHVRWKHNDIKKYQESNRLAKIQRDLVTLGNLKNFEVACFKCNNRFTVIEREKQHPVKEKYFCSRACANSRKHSQKTKNKISKMTSLALTHMWQNNIEYVNKCLKNGKHKKFNSKGEIEVREYFQDKFPNDMWTFGPCVINNQTIVRDMFSKKLKVCLEYDGVWHFKDIHGQLKNKQEKDLLLENWCKLNGYRLIRIKEDLYKSNKNFWLDKLEKTIYHSDDKLVKFY
jgi:hypothetical protein